MTDDELLQTAAELEKEQIRQMAEAKAARFPFHMAGDLEIKPTQWLVRDLLEADSMAVIYGDPGTCKSFIALDVSACVTTKTPFHGRRIVRPGPVIYLAGEGHNGLARRLSAWSKKTGVSLEGAPLALSKMPAALCEPGTMKAVAASLAVLAEKIGPPILIILDTWSRNLAGDENSSLDAAEAIAALDRLRAPWRAAGLIVHHVGHEKSRARGSTVLRGAVDLELRVDRGADTLIRVECTKAKDIPPPRPMVFRLDDIDLGILDEDGRTVLSGALTEEDWTPLEAPKTPSGKNQKLALDILAKTTERHRQVVADSGRDPDVARVTLAAWRDACAAAGIDRRRFCDLKKNSPRSRGNLSGK
jgi:hypothetical protein